MHFVEWVVYSEQGLFDEKKTWSGESCSRYNLYVQKWLAVYCAYSRNSTITHIYMPSMIWHICQSMLQTHSNPLLTYCWAKLQYTACDWHSILHAIACLSYFWDQCPFSVLVVHSEIPAYALLAANNTDRLYADVCENVSIILQKSKSQLWYNMDITFTK